MPLYEYRCSKCHKTFELIRKFSDPPLTEHEGCGGSVEQLLSAPAFQLKGTGWYVTDYAKTGAAPPASSKSESGDGKSGESKSSESKSAESKSGDSKGSDSKTGESKASESKPGESKSEQKGEKKIESSPAPTSTKAD